MLEKWSSSRRKVLIPQGDEIDALFHKLEEAINSGEVYWECPELSKVDQVIWIIPDASEFMFMSGVERDGIARFGFKHCVTRDYITLVHHVTHPVNPGKIYAKINNMDSPFNHAGYMHKRQVSLEEAAMLGEKGCVIPSARGTTYLNGAFDISSASPEGIELINQGINFVCQHGVFCSSDNGNECLACSGK